MSDLEDDGILLQLGDRPLAAEDGLDDLQEVLARQEAGVVLLEVLDEVVEDEEGSWLRG